MNILPVTWHTVLKMYAQLAIVTILNSSYQFQILTLLSIMPTKSAGSTVVSTETSRKIVTYIWPPRSQDLMPLDLFDSLKNSVSPAPMILYIYQKKVSGVKKIIMERHITIILALPVLIIMLIVDILLCNELNFWLSVIIVKCSILHKVFF